jgi:hypothetical protein
VSAATQTTPNVRWQSPRKDLLLLTPASHDAGIEYAGERRSLLCLLSVFALYLECSLESL